MTVFQNMISEIRTAARFLSGLLKLSNTLDSIQLSKFRSKMEALLEKHYKQHWFPEKPNKGSGYRCLRINHKMDPIIAQAGFESGLEESSLRNLFPNELTLWVDPKEVSYRIGENGSICVIYDGSTCTVQFSHDYQDRDWNKINHSASFENVPYSIYPSANLEVSRPSCKESMRSNGSWMESYSGCIMDSTNRGFERFTFVSS